MTDAFVGIDLSEAGLALAVHQSDFRFECPLHPSTPNGIINKVKKLQRKLIALEASRIGTEIPIAAALHAAGLPAIVVNATVVQRLSQKGAVAGNRAEMLARLPPQPNQKKR